MQPSSATRFLRSFWGVRQVFVARVSPALRRAHGLEMPEVLLLEYVAKSDLSPSEIAAQLRLGAHAVSRSLGALEKRGLIRRALDPHDARRRVLSLTPAGQTRLEQALQTLEAEISAVLAALEPGALEALLSALERVAQTHPQEDA